MQMIQLQDISLRLERLQGRDLSANFSKFAVVGIQLRQRNADIEILYIQRALRPSDPWSGQIGFPGGHFEQQDLNYLETLKREYREEMGCDWSTDFPVIRLDDVQARKAGQLLDFYIRPICFFSDEDGFSYQQEEISGHFWVPIRRLVDPMFHIDFKLQRQSMQMTLPAIQIVDEQVTDPAGLKPPPLWGLSYMMTEILIRKMHQAGLMEWPRHWVSYPAT